MGLICTRGEYATRVRAQLGRGSFESLMNKQGVLGSPVLAPVCPVAEASRKIRVVGTQSFLLDSDSSQVQRVSLSVLAL